LLFNVVSVVGFCGAFGIVFIHLGRAVIRGKLADTYASGLSAAVYGLFWIACFMGGASSKGYLGFGLISLFGVGFIVSGTLALIGKKSYREWRGLHP
jgi:hypothetical protein